MVDLYDDRRLVELLCIETPKQEATDKFAQRVRDILGDCPLCMRELWEAFYKAALKRILVFSHADELQNQTEREELLAQTFNREHPWVKSKLDKMPKLRPSIKISLHSLITRHDMKSFHGVRPFYSGPWRAPWI